MKSAATMLFSVGLTAVACAEAPVMRDAATHEQLVETYRKVAQEAPARNFKPIKGEDPSKALIGDLKSRSDVISFGGMTVMVPKRAILHVPANLKSRLEPVPGSKLYGWRDFYNQNRGWVTTVEVTRRQAEGADALDEKVVERFAKSTSLIVATFQGGPISVLPPQKPAEVEKPEVEAKPAQP